MKYVHSICCQKQLAISNHVSIPCEEKGQAGTIVPAAWNGKARHLSVRPSADVELKK